MKTNNAKKGTVPRLLKMIAGFYPVMFPATIALIIFNAIVRQLGGGFVWEVIECESFAKDSVFAE